MKKSKLSKLKSKLWDLCRDIIRKQHGYVCYTCGSPVEHPHTGHFISSSICSTELRYDLKNLRPQCYVCNIHKSGNWLAFEAKLIRDHGQKYVNELKKRNQLTKGGSYREDWYEQKVAEYQAILGNSTIPN